MSTMAVARSHPHALRAALEAEARSWLGGVADRSALAPSACADLVTALARDLERLFAGLASADAPLQEYPEALRCTDLVAQRWRHQTQRLLTRLEADCAALAAWVGEPLAGIVAVDTGLSDPHHGGATVLRLRDAQGRFILYKPRSLALDAVWAEVVERCRARGLRLARQPRCLPRDGYGWVEHMERTPCRNGDELLAYAHGAGGTLALAWLLGASDLHDGN
jgi:lantibiotic modifying enzyme